MVAPVIRWAGVGSFLYILEIPCENIFYCLDVYNCITLVYWSKCMSYIITSKVCNFERSKQTTWKFNSILWENFIETAKKFTPAELFLYQCRVPTGQK